MRHFLDWKHYSAKPEIKRLIEEKGMSYVKRLYQQEVNRVQWMDPNIGAR